MNVVVPFVGTPDAEAVMVIEPAVTPVTLIEAMPLDAVEDTRPLTVPAPPVFAKEIEVVLSVIRTFSFASRISAVSVRAVVDARSAIEEVNVR